MARELTLSVVAPDREVLNEQVQSVILPGQAGYFGSLAGHEPIISALKPGFLEYRDPNGTRHFVAIDGGFAEVTGDHVSVLSDGAERATEIDIARAEEDLEKARETMRTGDASLNEAAVAEIERAMNRIKVARMR